MLRAPCPACLLGQHAYHQETVRASMPGLIGSGHVCPCEGECRTSPTTQAARDEIARIVETALAVVSED